MVKIIVNENVRINVDGNWQITTLCLLRKGASK